MKLSFNNESQKKAKKTDKKGKFSNSASKNTAFAFTSSKFGSNELSRQSANRLGYKNKTEVKPKKGKVN